MSQRTMGASVALAIGLGLLLAVGLVKGPALAAPSGEYQGTVVSVDAEKSKIQTMNQKEEKAEFEVPKNCKITLDDKEAVLKELVAGTTVTITSKKQDEKQVATKIVARSAE